MKTITRIAAVLALGIAGVADATPPLPPPPGSIAGQYQIQAGYALIEVQDIGESFFRIRCPDENWTSVGVLDGKNYVGVFRKKSASGFTVGRHLIDWTAGDHPIEGQFLGDANLGSSRKWNRIPPAKPHEPTNTGLPAFGEYVPVDILPEAITKVQPVFPDIPKGSTSVLDGTVIVQALMLENGTVGDTRIVKSLPGFDDAAMTAVRQWKFTPAVVKGKPVAVWVAVPIKFTKR